MLSRRFAVVSFRSGQLALPLTQLDDFAPTRRGTGLYSERVQRLDETTASRSSDPAEMLAEIVRADHRLTERYRDVLIVNPDLDRTLVSFQANKAAIVARWFKYREGFSDALMQYLFNRLDLTAGRILDPFAGSGTALFAASRRGFDAVGIELLPSSCEIIAVRQLLMSKDRHSLATAVEYFAEERRWERPGPETPFPHLRITEGAFPPTTELLLGRYLYEAGQVNDADLTRLLRFAALSILESVSYTRKDGQYLRWDHRSGRRAGIRLFDKGQILEFTPAITAKLREVASDLRIPDEVDCLRPRLFDRPRTIDRRGRIELLEGSCLDMLPHLEADSFDGLITSPPYCNRYDYTRTYALELAMLGVGEEGVRGLRQAMLSCTVENRDKTHLADDYPRSVYDAATTAWTSQEMLQLVLCYLEARRADGTINNPGIPRMVRNYFAEMALVIFECARVLKAGAPLVMVNDNVRYQGAHVPVDLILADIAQHAGFDIETIWVLPRGKGNSSQQMSVHGRAELRKCVYVWRRTTATPANQLSQPVVAVR
jgi:hypothetical protein